jgi:hypothetical protein
MRFICISFSLSRTIKYNFIMNDSSDLYSYIQTRTNIQLADRLLSIYSLALILIGTPCNLLCCLIYFQKTNRTNSIKTIFGYLAFLDTIVLYTFNLNYVIREFNIDVQLSYYNQKNSTIKNSYMNNGDNINIVVVKKNLEEYSLFVCRFLSYLGKKKQNHSTQLNIILIMNTESFENICLSMSSSFFNFTNIILGPSIRFIQSLFINKKSHKFTIYL